MSTDDTTTTSSSSSSGHPDFEALSAHVDGEAPEVAAHVAGCAECRTKLKWLRTAIALVATPVPPADASVREQVLARAGDAFDRRPAVVADAAGREPAAGVSPLATSASDRAAAAEAPGGRRSESAGPPPAPVPIGAGRRARARGGSGLWVGLGSVAAVIVAVLVGMSALGGGSGDDGNTVAAGPAPERNSTGTASDSAAGASIGDAATDNSAESAGGLDGGDLGQIGDAATLVAKAAPALAQSRSPLSAPQSGPAPAGLTADAPPITPKVVGTRPCEMEARAARPGLGTVVYFATGQVDGVPVMVLGFQPGLPPADVTLLALAQQEGCRIVLEAAGP